MADALTKWQLRTEPRPWQVAALEAWRQRGRRGIAKVVTGAGKTVFGEQCIVDFTEAVPGGQVLVVVPTAALLDQWYVELQQDLGLGEEDIATFSGEGRAEQPRRVNLAVLNTAREVARPLSDDAPTLLIVDECHRAAAPVNAQALAGDHAATLGLSATPEREWDQSFHEVLVPALGGIFYEYDYGDALRDGVITPFDLVNVQVFLREEEQARYDALTRRVRAALRAFKAGEEDDSRLKRALRDRAAVSARAAMRIPVATALANAHRGERTVIFHEAIPAAEEIRTLLERRDHNVTVYHSQIAPARRRDNLRLFRLGVFDILVSCRALDEGINVPETEVGIVASATASRRQRIQRLGRVLRPSAGKERALVYTLFASEQEERRLAEEAQETGASSVTWRKAAMPGA